MEPIQKSLLEANGIVNQGQIYFVYRWLELFNKFTIDTFRFRAMNSKSIIHEVLQIIDLVEKGVWDESNLKLASEEALYLINNDPVMEEYTYIFSIKKVLEQGINKPSSIEERLKIKILLTGLFSDLDTKYWLQLIDGLKRSIHENNLRNVEWFVCSLASELIHQGHDREFLYQIMWINLRKSTRAFDDFYNDLITTVKPIMARYVTYSKIKAAPNEFQGLVLGHEFKTDINIASTDRKVQSFLSSEDPKVFAISEISAMDPNAAALVAHSKLGYLLDVMNYSNPKSNLLLEPDCLVVYNENNGIYRSVPDLVGYVPDQNWFAKVEKQLCIILASTSLSPESKDKLKGALRYFRLSNQATNIEHRFLNLWIMLEHLIRSGVRHKSIIEPIVEFIPKTLALNYVKRLLNDTIANVIRCGVQIPDDLKIHFQKKSNSGIIDICRNETNFAKLIASVSGNPLLEMRLSYIKNIVTNSKEIKNCIEKNNRDINQHLARMYRARNQIVHSAAHDLNIWGLTANLHYYVRTILNILLYEISNFDCFQDLWGVYIKYRTAYDQYVHYLKHKDISFLDSTIVDNPMRLFWP